MNQGQGHAISRRNALLFFGVDASKVLDLQSSNSSITSVVRRVKLLWTNCHWLDQSLRKQSKRCVKRVAVTIACDWGAKWIVIFKLPNDLLDLCAAEKLGRVSKTGIVASA